MTSSPTSARLLVQTKAGGSRFPKWDEDEHPRDRKGRFIETGAEVRIWGGQTGTVLRNVGGGKIEVQRADGQKVIVHRNYLTVTASASGGAPKVERSEAPAALPVEDASPDAEVVPELAEGDDVALPDRGDAPDLLVDTITPGETMNGRTVGEYIDGPAAIDGWVVGFTEQGGVYVRTEEGVDWPLLPDAVIASDPEGPEMPTEWLSPEAATTDAPEARTPEVRDDQETAGNLRATDRVVIDGQPATIESVGTDPNTDGLSHGNNVRLRGAFDDGSRLDREFPRDTAFDLPGEQQRPEPGAADAAPQAGSDAPGASLNSINPSESGVFEDYASGREFRATAPLGENMTTLDQRGDVDADEMVTVYRGVPKGQQTDLAPGDFITTDRQLAQDYAGTGDVIETEVRAGDVLSDVENDEEEGEEFLYRPGADAELAGANPAALADRLNAPEAQRARLGTAPEAEPDEEDVFDDRQRAAQGAVDRRMADSAVDALSPAIEVENEDPDAVRTLAADRIATARAEGAEYADVVVGEMGARIYLDNGQVQRVRADEFGGPIEREAPAGSPSDDRQRMLDAIAAAGEADPEQSAMWTGLAAAIGPLDDAQARAMLDAVSVAPTPGSRALRDALSADPGAAIVERLNDPEVQRSRLGPAPEADLDEDERRDAVQREAQERVDARGESDEPPVDVDDEVRLNGEAGTWYVTAIDGDTLTVRRRGEDRTVNMADVEVARRARRRPVDREVEAAKNEWLALQPGEEFILRSRDAQAGVVETLATVTAVEDRGDGAVITYRDERGREQRHIPALRERPEMSTAGGFAVDDRVTLPNGRTATVRAVNGNMVTVLATRGRGFVEQDFPASTLTRVDAPTPDVPDLVQRPVADLDDEELAAERDRVDAEVDRMGAEMRRNGRQVGDEYPEGYEALEERAEALAEEQGRRAREARRNRPNSAESGDLPVRRDFTSDDDASLADARQRASRALARRTPGTETHRIVERELADIDAEIARREQEGDAPETPNDSQSTVGGHYSVGDTVEVEVTDFSQPSHPRVWRRGTVERIEHTGGGLSDVFVIGEDGERLPTQRVGSRGGNGAIRKPQDAPEPEGVEAARPSRDPGLDDRWTATGGGLFRSDVSRLREGDVIYTEGEGTEASPVALPSNPPTGILSDYQKRQRTVARVEGTGRSRTVHFTDGTSTGSEGGDRSGAVYSGRAPVFAVPAYQRDSIAPDSAEGEEGASEPGRVDIDEAMDRRDARRSAIDERLREDGISGVDEDVLNMLASSDTFNPYADGDEMTGDDYRGLAEEAEAARDLAPEDRRGQYEGLIEGLYSRAGDMDDADRDADEQEFDFTGLSDADLAEAVDALEPGEDGSEEMLAEWQRRVDAAGNIDATAEMSDEERTQAIERLDTLIASDSLSVRDREVLVGTREAFNRGPDQDAVDVGADEPDESTVMPRLNFRTQDVAEEAGYVFDSPAASDLTVGQRVVVRSRGAFREARITGIGRTRVTVEYTTDGAVDEQRRIRETLAGRDPETERVNAEQRARRHWDWMQSRSSRDTYEVGRYFIEHGWRRRPSDPLLTGEEAREAYLDAHMDEIETARQWIAENPDREAYAAKDGQDTFDKVAADRAAALALTPADDVRNAHVTTYTTAASKIGRRPLSMDNETEVGRRRPGITILRRDDPANVPADRREVRAADVEVGQTVVLGGREYGVSAIHEQPDRGSRRFVLDAGDGRTSEVDFDDDDMMTVRVVGVAGPTGNADADVAQMLADVLADTTLSDETRTVRATILNDPRTRLHRGLLIHRSHDNRRAWGITSPDGMRRIMEGGATEAEAEALVDGLVGIRDANGDAFDWASPGVQARIDEFRGPDGERIGRPMGAVRSAVAATDIDPSDWNPPVLRYGADADSIRLDSVNPDLNPDAATRREAVQRMFSFAHDKSGWSTRWNYVSESGLPGGYGLRGRIVDRDGHEVGSLVRSVYRNRDGEMEVHHDELIISAQHQGQGFADAYYKHLFDAYERQGVDVVTIHANIDVGGYAWARRGFDWDPRHPKPKGRMVENLNALLDSPQGRRFTPEQRERIEQFRLDLASPTNDWTPAQIAAALSDIRWERTTRAGVTVPMWPGKHAMLGTNWHGRRQVGESNTGPEFATVDVPSRDLATMSDEDLATEQDDNAALLADMLNVQRRPGDDPSVLALSQRQAAIAVTRSERLVAASEALLPDGEYVFFNDLSEGDLVVVPVITDRTPQIATVVSVTDVGYEEPSVRVRYDDNTEATVVLPRDSALVGAQWRRGEPPKPMVRVDDLAAGDEVMLDDRSIATVTGVERDGDLYVVGVTLPDGTAMDVIASDASTTMPRVTSYEETYTPVTDMTDEELQAESLVLNRRHRVESNLTPAERMRRESLVAEIRHREAVRTVDVETLPAATPTARPRLYTYQRQAIVALNLDGARSGSSPEVAQAAARVRARLPLTGEQSRVLAAEIRRLTAEDDGLGVRARRSRERLAVAFDVSAAVAEGRSDAPGPVQTGVERVRPSGLASGDTAVIRGADGALEAVKVLAARPMMRGTLVRLTVEREDGSVEERIVDRDVDTWLVPDLPEPTPEIPEVGRELVAAADIRVGDTISAERDDRAVTGRVTAIERDGQGNFRISTDDDETPMVLPTRALTHRTSRGEQSANQPVLLALPDTDDRVAIATSEARVGDYVETRFPARAVRGTVLATTRVEGGEDSSGYTSLSILSESGEVVTVVTPDGTTHVAFRHASAADNISEQIADEFEDQRLRGQRYVIAGWLDAVQRSVAQSAGAVLEDFEPTGDTEVDEEWILDRLRRGFAAARTDFNNRVTARKMWDHLGAEAGAPIGNESDGQRAMEDLVASVRTDGFGRIINSIAAARHERLPEETPQDAYRRVLAQWRDNPPKRDPEAMALSISQSLSDFVGGNERTSDLPEVSPDAPLADRMKAYRARIGDAPVGHRIEYRSQYSPAGLDLGALERGEVPEVHRRPVQTRPRAADGGPAEKAMRDVETLRAAGGEVAAEVDRRMDEAMRAAAPVLPGLDPMRPGESWESYQRRMDAHIENLSMARTIAHERAMDRRVDARDEAARAAGAADYADLSKRRLSSEAARWTEAWESARDADESDAEYLRLMEEFKDMRARHEEASEAIRDRDIVRATAMRNATLAVLSEIREMGGVRLKYQKADAMARGQMRTRGSRGEGAALGERDKHVKAMRQAEDVLPADWLRAIESDMPTRYQRDAIGLSTVKRGHADWQGNIRLSQDRPAYEGDNGMGGVAVHELGHFAQRAVPGLAAAEEAFLWSRTSTGAVGSRQRERMVNMAGRGGDSSQFGYADDFPTAYTGVDYTAMVARRGGSGSIDAWEVITTGVESLFAGSPYLDEDFRKFLLGALAVV